MEAHCGQEMSDANHQGHRHHDNDATPNLHQNQGHSEGMQNRHVVHYNPNASGAQQSMQQQLVNPSTYGGQQSVMNFNAMPSIPGYHHCHCYGHCRGQVPNSVFPSESAIDLGNLTVSGAKVHMPISNMGTNLYTQTSPAACPTHPGYIHLNRQPINNPVVPTQPSKPMIENTHAHNVIPVSTSEQTSLAIAEDSSAVREMEVSAVSSEGRHQHHASHEHQLAAPRERQHAISHEHQLAAPRERQHATSHEHYHVPIHEHQHATSHEHQHATTHEHQHAPTYEYPLQHTSPHEHQHVSSHEHHHAASHDHHHATSHEHQHATSNEHQHQNYEQKQTNQEQNAESGGKPEPRITKKDAGGFSGESAKNLIYFQTEDFYTQHVGRPKTPKQPSNQNAVEGTQSLADLNPNAIKEQKPLAPVALKGARSMVTCGGEAVTERRHQNAANYQQQPPEVEPIGDFQINDAIAKSFEKVESKMKLLSKSRRLMTDQKLSRRNGLE